MSTFFEKLTGARALPTDSTEEPIKTASRPVRKTSRPSTLQEKPMHLKVESDDSRPTPQESLPPEEEGELTVDIYDRGDSIVIQSTVAGVKPEDLDVSITSDTVTIRGKRESAEEVSEDNYYYKELFWGNFSRSVILPEEIEDDAAEASLKHGLLTIVLPKKRRGVVSKLKVKSL